MRRNVLAIASALVLTAMSPLTAFAASPTTAAAPAAAAGQAAVTEVTGTETPAQYAAETSASEGFTVAPVEQSVVNAAVAAVQNLLLGDLSSIGTRLGNAAIISAAGNAGQKVTAKIVTVVNVDPTTAAKDADGNYVVKLNIPSIAAGEALAVLHYTGSGWEVIIPSSVENGAVTFKTRSLSPISVVKLSTSSLVAAPRTGEMVSIALILMVCGIAGAVFCAKRAAAE